MFNNFNKTNQGLNNMTSLYFSTIDIRKAYDNLCTKFKTN